MIHEIVEECPTVKKRWEAWWERELYDRALIWATAPRDGVALAEIENVEQKTKWTDASR